MHIPFRLKEDHQREVNKINVMPEPKQKHET